MKGKHEGQACSTVGSTPLAEGGRPFLDLKIRPMPWDDYGIGQHLLASNSYCLVWRRMDRMVGSFFVRRIYHGEGSTYLHKKVYVGCIPGCDTNMMTVEYSRGSNDRLAA